MNNENENKVENAGDIEVVGVSGAELDAACSRKGMRVILPAGRGEVLINPNADIDSWGALWKVLGDKTAGAERLAILREAFAGSTDFRVRPVSFGARSRKGVQVVELGDNAPIVRRDNCGVATAFNVLYSKDNGKSWYEAPAALMNNGIAVSGAVKLPVARQIRYRLKKLVLDGMSWSEVIAAEKAKAGKKLSASEALARANGENARLREVLKAHGIAIDGEGANA